VYGGLNRKFSAPFGTPAEVAQKCGHTKVADFLKEQQQLLQKKEEEKKPSCGYGYGRGW